MDSIRVYTKKRCPYCTSAKIWLRQKGYTYEEISLDDPEEQTKFITENTKYKTVPQIFVGTRHIGGFAELIKSDLA